MTASSLTLTHRELNYNQLQDLPVAIASLESIREL